MAIDYWRLLISHGLSGGALSYIGDAEDEDDAMVSGEEGWRPEFLEWWITYLRELDTKGVSKDTWTMVSWITRSLVFSSSPDSENGVSR
jgi:DCN1-like protein 1/2